LVDDQTFPPANFNVSFTSEQIKSGTLPYNYGNFITPSPGAP